jgi:hypothetical protein
MPRRSALAPLHGCLSAARLAVAGVVQLRAYEVAVLNMAIVYVALLLFALALRGGAEDVAYDDGALGADSGAAAWEASFQRNAMPVIDCVFVGLFAADLGLKLCAGHAARQLRSSVVLLEASVVASACAFTTLELLARYARRPSGVLAAPVELVLRVGRSVRLLLAMLKLGALREARRRLGFLSMESAVEAPVYKVLALLHALAERAVSESDQLQLEWMVDVIGSNRLYTTVLSTHPGGPGRAVDKETAAWLKSQYSVESAAPPSHARGTLATFPRRESVAQGRRRSLAHPHDDAGCAVPHPATVYGLASLSTDEEKALHGCLRDVERWDFDVFALHRTTAGRPLVPLVMAICARHNFFERFTIEPSVLARCLGVVQASYAPVPYHNRLHAADVTQTLYALLSCDVVADHVDDVELFAAVLAAACHGARARPRASGAARGSRALARRRPSRSLSRGVPSVALALARGSLRCDAAAPRRPTPSRAVAPARVSFSRSRALSACALPRADLGHPGLNNPFHVKHLLDAAVLYNDASVLEHSHASRAWQALNAPEHDVLAHVPPAEASTIRQTLISMILGTDMSGHFDELAKFAAKTKAGGLQVGSDADTQLILRMVLHCADVSNPAKGPDICIPWAVRVMDEFFMQVKASGRNGRRQRTAATGHTEALHSGCRQSTRTGQHTEHAAPPPAPCTPPPPSPHAEAHARAQPRRSRPARGPPRVAAAQPSRLALPASAARAQGDKEKSLGHAPSPFMDRENTAVSKCQAGFIKIIVTPLFQAWHAFCKSESAQRALDGCQHNADEWLRCGDERVGEWLRARGLERDDPLISEHGPRRDARCNLPPVSERELRFHHAVVVEYRCKRAPADGDKTPRDPHAMAAVEPACFGPSGASPSVDSRLRSARQSIHAALTSALARAPRRQRSTEPPAASARAQVPRSSSVDRSGRALRSVRSAANVSTAVFEDGFEPPVATDGHIARRSRSSRG